MQVHTATADTEALQALTAALQACGTEPQTSPSGARAALAAADAAARALLHLAADPAQHAAALAGALRWVGGMDGEQCSVKVGAPCSAVGSAGRSRDSRRLGWIRCSCTLSNKLDCNYPSMPPARMPPVQCHHALGSGCGAAAGLMGGSAG